MTDAKLARQLRVFHFEDNPLLAMFVKELIEDLGHSCVGCSPSYAEFRARTPCVEFDCALIDIDLADGRTGPEAAIWLKDQGIAVIFLSGQEQVTREHAHLAHACLSKPVSRRRLKAVLSEIAGAPAAT